MARLKKHRKTYGPVMDRLSSLHSAWAGFSEPVQITMEEDMLTILELLTIEYLDPDAFKITKSFGEYRALYYLGGFPFTAKGERFLAERHKKRVRVIVGAVAASVAIALLLFALF